MSTRSRWLRLLALFGVLAMVAAACGDDEPEADEDDDAASQPADPAPEPAGGEETWILGQVLPETGPLDFLGPPMLAGVELAIEDLEAAGFGNVFGEIQLETVDDNVNAADVREGGQRIINDGAHTIVGAGASSSTQEIIQLTNDSSIPQCSPSNSSPVFSTQANADPQYFRTVPPDGAVAGIIADKAVEAAGDGSVAIYNLSDDYGNPLAALIETAITDELGAEVVGPIAYDPTATTFDSEIGQLGDAAAVVVIGFGEAGPLVNGLIEAGVDPAKIVGSDGVAGPPFTAKVDPDDPTTIDGMVVVGAAASDEFNVRVAEKSNGALIYGGQAYDCVMIMALAIEAAGGLDGADIIAEINGVTRDGTKCTDFAECRDLIADGEDIDYDGVSGDLEFTDSGDPLRARYAVAEFEGGKVVPLESIDVDLVELGLAEG